MEKDNQSQVIAISDSQLRIIADLTVKLTKLRQKSVGCCV